jgi:hypothetical protein
MNTDIFRLAAVLYADNNYEVNPKTIHRKIIESIFIDKNNHFIGVHELIDLINEKYSLVFTVEEISELVSDGNFFNTSPCKSNEFKISLTNKRFTNISNKINANNLDYFISEFHKANRDLDFEYLRKTIYSFLYEIFQTNITSFSKLIDPKTNIEEIININDLNFSPLEIEIINAFLNWENDDKNKSIFDISNLALEYCLISNKKSNNFKLDNLKNKSFYLDTNIVFRAIGLNGENRQKRTITFLEKFKEANENLIISSFTNEEIKSTINYYTNQLGRYSSARINSEVFNAFSKSGDFIDYYHKWRKKRNNDSLDLFISHLMSLIEELKKAFKIKNDFSEHFDLKDSKINDIILDKGSQINTFKSINKNSSSYLESCITDAKNVFLIENLRNGHFSNIFDCKYYFISSDQYLRKWDYTTNNAIPIVLLPSQWMNILLRYLNRTSDDFKSFVSFLNINNPEKGISNENLHLILNGISEITSDFTQQRSIISEMINLKFKGILDKLNTNEQTIENSRLFAKTKLENDVETLLKKNEKLENKFEKYQENTSGAIDELKRLKDSEKEDKQKEVEKNMRIISELIDTKAKLDFNRYKSRAYYCIPILILCLLYFVLLFTFQSSSWNMIAVYTNYANALNEGSMQKEVCKWIWLLPSSGILYTSIFIYNRILDKENRRIKLDGFRKIYTEQLEK